MPFEIRTVMEQRLEMVKLAMQPGANLSQLSKRYNVSRRVLYKWLNRYSQEGLPGLADQSKRPHVSPLQTDISMEKKIIDLRRQNPEWGARKLRAILQREGKEGTPSQSTINAILGRNNLIKLEKSRQQAPVQRFEYSNPNELWQMDFKGGFRLLDKSDCYPLTITDDHSRFNLCLAACDNQQGSTVKQTLITIFRKYGLPDMILADNGSPWGTAGHISLEGETALSALEIWLIQLQVKVIHGRFYHPQTQGKEERFHRTLKTELLQYEQFKNLHHCQQRFDKWRRKYNLERPHQAIGLKTPAELYKHSLKNFPEIMPQIQYSQTDIVCKVGSSGFINFKKQYIKVGKGLIGQHVALRPTATENIWHVYFCNQLIKNIFVNK